MAKKQKSKKRIVALVIILAIVAILLVLFFVKKYSAKKAVDETQYTVRKETLENNIEISGNIEAAEIQTLQAQGDGTVRKVFAKEGDIVKKGQVILQLDSDEEDYNIAKHDYDYEQKKVTGAAKELEIMQRQREMLVKKMEKRQVISNIDGILVALDAAPEDYFEAKDEVGTIVDRSYLKAEVEVVETDAPKLKVGQTVKMTFPSYSEEVIGTIVSYPSVGRITTRGATVVDAEIRVDNPPAEILPKYSFTGKIEISAPETVYIVERSAIGRDKGKTFVEIIEKDGSIRKQDVKIEPYGDGYVKIVSEISEGIVLKNQNKETSGANARQMMRQMGVGGPPQQNNRNSSGSKTGNQSSSGGGPMGGPPGGM